MKKCIYCSSLLYQLKNGMVKCSACKKKYSLKRIDQIYSLIQCFCNDENALQASKELNLNYVTVLKYYQRFRHLCAEHCEFQYHQHQHSQTQYEEHFYIDKSKRSDKISIFDAHNFLIFGYDTSVYTLMLPSLGRFKQQFLKDDLEDRYHKEFSKFMRTSKIIKVYEHDNVIEKFWHYFEVFLMAFKGVSNEHFPYYLKEAEFKFNTPFDQRKAILFKLYFRPDTSET